MANSLVATKQTAYQTDMMTLLGESKGAELWKVCDADRSVTGEKTTFYRMTASTVKTGINGYSDTPNNTGGDTDKLEVSPSKFYSDINLGYTDFKNTNLDIKGSFMRSFVSALKRSEDLAIIAKIDAATTGTGGVVGEYISSDTNVDTLIEAISYAIALAKDNQEHGIECMVAMSREDWAKLRTANKLTNSDFKEGLLRDDKGTSLCGGYIVPVEGITPGKVYVIPNETVCFASWSDGDKALMKDLDAKDEVYVMARKTYGVEIFAAEALFITVLTFKDPTT